MTTLPRCTGLARHGQARHHGHPARTAFQAAVYDDRCSGKVATLPCPAGQADVTGGGGRCEPCVEPQGAGTAGVAIPGLRRLI